jgi:hypothetical protein
MMNQLIMDTLISQLVTQQKNATPIQLARIVTHVATAPFASDLLEADESLWGGFWHFDVIGPGYSLPAVELALLRAVRLDRHWPEDTTVDQFLTDLRQAILHPQAGVWTLTVIGQPCVVFAAPTSAERQNLATVAWYCASMGQLQAGYRATVETLHFAEAVEQHAPEFTRQPEGVKDDKPGWLALAVEQIDVGEKSNLAAQLDAAILRWRLG